MVERFWRAAFALPRLLFALLFGVSPVTVAAAPDPVNGTYVARDFAFADGSRLPALTLAYTTLGMPHRNAAGEIDNAVLLIHGTGGNGRTFLTPAYAEAMFGPGKPLDAARHYLIMPDSIGHGGSSKPSDGMRMTFPRYDYADMVEGHRRLLVEHLGIRRLKLVLGFSMGGMLTFEWATRHPDMARAFVPMGCYPVEIGGQNRMQRKLQIDAIKADPAWREGNYGSPPVAGQRAAAGIVMLMSGSPLAYTAQAPTRAGADRMLEEQLTAMVTGRDANDSLYQIDASRNYNPWDRLGAIRAPLFWINIGDDLVNPPALDIAPRALARMPDARFLLVPASAETRGHGTLMMPQFWAADLTRFLANKGLAGD